MVLNCAKDSSTPRLDLIGAAAILPAAAFGLLVAGVVGRAPILASPETPRGTVEAIAATLFPSQGNSAYPILFLAVGLLLLTAIVGAVLLAKRRLESLKTPEGEH